MALLIDPLILLTSKDKTAWEVYTSDPVSGDFDGQIIINSTDNVFKIWYNGTWNTLGITITPGTPPTASYLFQEDGASYILLEDGFKLVQE